MVILVVGLNFKSSSESYLKNMDYIMRWAILGTWPHIKFKED